MSGRGHRGGRRPPSKIFMLDLALLGLIFWAGYHTYVSLGLGRVRAISNEQQQFWDDRVGDMRRQECIKNAAFGVSLLLPDGDPVRQLVHLAGSDSQRQALWQAYEGCLEPKTFVVPEDLLHFKVDRFNDFEGDPRQAFAMIRRYVDENITSRRAIFILGHTDDTFTVDYNAELSYRRARTSAALVEEHLTAKGLQSGRDFALYPIGMGETQLLPRGDLDLDSWRKASRRMELSFRGRGVGNGFASAGLP
jgi:outer membrane protein OmpA-like peptidoglycan-associated protein